MKMSRTAFVGQLAILSLTAGLALSARAEDRSPQDAQALAKVHLINQAEVKVGQLAEKRAKADAARSYAQMLEKDHASNDQTLMSLARQEKIDLSAAQSAQGVQDLKKKLDDMYDSLNNAKTDFDRAFAQAMSDGHNDALALVQQASAATKNTAVKQFLETLRPALEDHKKMADSLVGQLRAH